MLSLVATAFAVALRITPSPEAAVEVLAPTEPGKAEILVHGNSLDLRPPTRGAPLPDGVRAWRVRNTGGAWVITVWLRDEHERLELVREGDTWVGRPVPVPPAEDLSFLTGHALDELLAEGAVPSTCQEPPAKPAALVPLVGRDARYAERRIEAFVPSTERWIEAEPGGGDAEPGAHPWAEIESARRLLAGGVLVADRPALLYRLGALHRDAGHLREAAYYFQLADATGAPRGYGMLQRSEALARLRLWGPARDAVLAARAGGAPTGAVVEMMAALAMAGESTDPIGFARLVGQHTSHAADQRLAGLLLLRQGCTAEAAKHLEAAIAADPDDLRARLLLVDARLLRGDASGARDVLADVPEGSAPGELAVARRARSRVLALLQQPVDQWPASVPVLVQASRQVGEEGDEALHLLGQIGDRLGETRLALDSWLALVDRDRDFAAGEPGRRLYATWWARVRGLVSRGRKVDALAFHGGAWRPGLAIHLADPAALRDLALAYADAGLAEPAIELWRAVADWEGVHHADDRATVLELARLYRETGHVVEAGEALDFLGARAGDAQVDAGASLLRGRLAEDAGDSAAALAWYAKVGGTLAPEARLRAALLDAHDGRCAAALPALVAPAGGLPTDVTEALVVAMRARCLTAVGRDAEGRQVAAAAALLLLDDDAAGWAAYTAGDALPADRRPADGLWARLGKDDAAEAVLRARVEKLRAPPPAP